jgi:hypothetical protein
MAAVGRVLCERNVLEGGRRRLAIRGLVGALREAPLLRREHPADVGAERRELLLVGPDVLVCFLSHRSVPPLLIRIVTV